MRNGDPQQKKRSATNAANPLATIQKGAPARNMSCAFQSGHYATGSTAPASAAKRPMEQETEHVGGRDSNSLTSRRPTKSRALCLCAT